MRGEEYLEYKLQLIFQKIVEFWYSKSEENNCACQQMNSFIALYERTIPFGTRAPVVKVLISQYVN